MNANSRRVDSHPRRQGYLYVAVLFTALVVSTMGLVALSAASLRMRSAIDARDWSDAQVLAQSAVEDAIHSIEAEDSWRSVYAHDVEYPTPARSLDNGTFTWKLVDEDGDLADDDSDSVRVVGIGRVGRVAVAESVRLLPTGQPLSSLGSALHCHGDIVLGDSVEFRTDQQVSSNSNISAGALLASLDGDAEAVGTVTGNVSGAKIEGAPPRRLPGSSVFDYYLDNGTPISLAALPDVAGVRVIGNRVISPLSNPFGERNPEGIYVIDCGGQQVCIKNSRIVGTIVLLNPDPRSSLEGSLRWDAAVSNYPALLVLGDLQMKVDSTALSESLLITNFNPPEAPYEDQSDHDILDTYPSEINGVVYLSGQLNSPANLMETRFRGVAICRSINAASNCRFQYLPLFFDVPPPGFASGNPMVVSPGSRRRETLP